MVALHKAGWGVNREPRGMGRVGWVKRAMGRDKHKVAHWEYVVRRSWA